MSVYLQQVTMNILRLMKMAGYHYNTDWVTDGMLKSLGISLPRYVKSRLWTGAPNTLEIVVKITATLKTNFAKEIWPLGSTVHEVEASKCHAFIRKNAVIGKADCQ